MWSEGKIAGIIRLGNFTFMPTSDVGPMYQLNIKTTGYPVGTYALSFTVSGDPVVHTVAFVIN